MLNTFCDAAKLSELAQVVSELSRDYVKAKNITPDAAYEQIAKDISFPDQQKAAFIAWAKQEQLFEQVARRSKQKQAEAAIERVLSGKKRKAPTLAERLARAVENIDLSQKPEDIKKQYIEAVSKLKLSDSEFARIQAGDTGFLMEKKNKDKVTKQIERRLEDKERKPAKTVDQKLAEAVALINKSSVSQDTAKELLSKIAGVDLSADDLRQLKANGQALIRQRIYEGKTNKAIDRAMNPKAARKMRSFVERLWSASGTTESSTRTDDIKNAYLSSVSGVEITDADRAIISSYARRAEKLEPGSAERIRLSNEMLSVIARKFPASRFSLLLSMNYSGMISSPFTFINNAVAGAKTKINAKLGALSHGLALYKYLNDAFSLTNPEIREAMKAQGTYALAFDTSRKSAKALEQSQKTDFQAKSNQSALANATTRDIFGKPAAVLPKNWQEANIGKIWQSVFDIQNATDVFISTQTDYYYLGRLLYEDISKKNPDWNDGQIFAEMDSYLHIKDKQTVGRAKEIVDNDPNFPFYQNPTSKAEKEANIIHAKRVQELLIKGFTYTDANGTETTYKGVDEALLSDAAYLTDLGMLKRSTEVRNPVTGETRPDLAGRMVGFLYGIDRALDSLINDKNSTAIRGLGMLAKFLKTQVIPFGRVTINFMDRRTDYVPLYANVKAARYASKRGKSALGGFLLNSKFDLAREQVEFQDRKLKAIKGMSTAILGLTTLALLSPSDDEDEREKQGAWVMVTGNGTGLPKGAYAVDLLNTYGRNRIVFGYGSDTRNFVTIPYGNDQMGLVLNMLSSIHNILKYASPEEKKGAEQMKDEEKTTAEKHLEMSAYMLGTAGQELFQGSFNTQSLKWFEGIQKVATKQQTPSQLMQEVAVSQGMFASNMIPYANGWRALEGAFADSEKVNKYYTDMAWSMLPFTRTFNKARPALDFFSRPITQVPAESTNILASMMSDYKKRIRSAPQAEIDIREWMADKRAVPTLNPTSSQMKYTILPGAKDLEGKVNNSETVKLRVMPEESKYELSVRTGLLCRMLFTDPDIVKELKSVTGSTSKTGAKKTDNEAAASIIRKVYSSALQVAKYDMLTEKGVGLDFEAAKIDAKIGTLIAEKYLPKLKSELSNWQKENNISF